MPLVKLEKINQNSSWALWKIEETEEQLMKYVQLPTDDTGELHDIHHPGKKLEWLSGDRKSTRLNSSHSQQSRMPSSA